MNIVYKYLDLTGHVLLFNTDIHPRIIGGHTLMPGESIGITAGAANTIHGMLMGKWTKIVRFIDCNAYEEENDVLSNRRIENESRISTP